MPFAFSTAGLIEKMLGQLKDHQLFDSNMETKDYKLKGGFTMNLEGRSISRPEDTVFNWFHQYVSVKKLNLSPLMLIGIISRRHEIDPTKFHKLIEDITRSVEHKEIGSINYYEFFGLCFIASMLKQNTPLSNSIIEKITQIEDGAKNKDDVQLLIKLVINGKI